MSHRFVVRIALLLEMDGNRIWLDKGQAYSFGNGDHGKLGHNHSLKVSAPRLIEALVGRRVVSIASYNEHTIALTGACFVNVGMHGGG